MSDPARTRFMVLQLVRLSGAVLVLVGAMAMSGRLGTVPASAGYGLVGAGLADFFVVPLLLSRRWKSRE